MKKSLYTYFRKIDAECVHIHAVEKTRKTLGKTCEAFMHKLELYEILLEVGHGIAQLCEAILQPFKRNGS